MSILLNTLKGKKRLAVEESVQYNAYHRYSNEQPLDGYISPMVLPHERLVELRGNDSNMTFAQRCHVPVEEISMLMDNEALEPTPRQLATIALWCNVSVFWLLGYHTVKPQQGFTSTDKELLYLIGRRNAAEQSLYQGREKGIFGELYRKIVQKRLTKYTLDIGNTAARVTASEHVPLTERELFILRGQPVFVEQSDGTAQWGLVMDNYIQTLTGLLDFDNNEETYCAYLTPRTT